MCAAWRQRWTRSPRSRSGCRSAAGTTSAAFCAPVSPWFSRERQIRTFASALVKQGQDPATLTSLRALVEIEALKTGLKYLIERSGGQATTAIYDFASALKAIARHHLHVEQPHLDQITRIMRRLDVGVRGLTQKNRSRLRQFDDPQNVQALLRLPHTLFALAARNPRPHAAALQAQTAVAIEILLMAALRISNLAMLDIEIPASETKTRQQPIEMPWPEALVASLETYLSCHRGVLVRLRRGSTPAAGGALWVSRKGSPMSRSSIYAHVTARTRDGLGRPVNPHLFRDCAATSIAIDDPRHIGIATPLLGHRSASTTEKYYNQASAVEASRTMQTFLLALRRGGDADLELATY